MELWFNVRRHFFILSRMPPPRLRYLRMDVKAAQMNPTRCWLEKRRKIRAEIARACSARTGISEADFLRLYYDGGAIRSTGDFDALHVPDRDTLDEILADIARSTGLEPGVVRGHLSRRETFPQFAERLLRSGAYGGEAA